MSCPRQPLVPVEGEGALIFQLKRSECPPWRQRGLATLQVCVRVCTCVCVCVHAHLIGTSSTLPSLSFPADAFTSRSSDLLCVRATRTLLQPHLRTGPPPSAALPLSLMAMLSEHSRLIQKFDTCRTAFMLCYAPGKVESLTQNFGEIAHVTNTMAAVHQLLGPERSVFVATELPPQGVGRHCQGIQLPDGTIIAEKVQVSMLVPEVRLCIFGSDERGVPPVQQVIIWGVETHGCILQTVDELLTHGIRVAILVDGCASNAKELHDTAVLQMSHWDGLMVTTAPSAVMQLTRSDARFVKAVVQILKKFGADWAATQQQPKVAAQSAEGDRDRAPDADGTKGASPAPTNTPTATAAAADAPGIKSA
ncbi:hypothetical protein LSCM1_07171 [Leishmania martiniquensis]|uniref:Isochorismatase-like domain-containing protein n=1 Tax=Leishmania martiniquensis TaxID=1580590 RepID=A0A836HKF9_9TRYP|nr:hypothetical protein LSCM1_07171 [Leishmania martiniquensis]